MPKPPAPPPEARLLKLARLNHRPRLSVADAARLAGVSPSLWRQVEAGYSTPASGVRVPKVAPPGTLAIMARPLGITPADLAGAQRADAAAVLADLLCEAPEPVAATGSLTLQPPAITADAEDAEAVASAGIIALLRPHERRVWEQIHAHPEGTPAEVIFDDPMERALWRRTLAPEDQRVREIAAWRSVQVRPTRPVRRAG